MTGAPRSKQFDDVYFSAEDGLAETRHVFINGNNLPENWKDRPFFAICETGFGTGLNFLVAATLFSQTAGENQKLHFISFEKFPLSRDEIKKALGHWASEFGERWNNFLALYPADLTDVRKMEINSSITLTLIFDDVNTAIPLLNEKIDCWFLDGFKPRTNPDMWSETVFQNMARLSTPKTTFATFTSVGFVKRGLQAVGFQVKKVKGYGTKWHMLIGHMP